MTDQDPKDKTRSAAKDTADDLSRRAQETVSEVRSQAEKAARDARDSARDYGNDTKNFAADETSKVADALRGAAGDLRDGSVQERLVGRLAEGVADAADSLRNRNIDDLGHEFSDFARRNPLAFLGGAALVGFAAGRFLKATSHDDDFDDDFNQYETVPAYDAPVPRAQTPASPAVPTPRAPSPAAPGTTATTTGGSAGNPGVTGTSGPASPQKTGTPGLPNNGVVRGASQ